MSRRRLRARRALGRARPDRRGVTFRLRPEAKFADGSPVTAAVVSSALKDPEQGHPRFSMALRDVVKAEAPEPHTVRFTFQGELTRATCR